MREQPSEKSMGRMRNFVEKYCQKSGTFTHPGEGVTEAVVLGLAENVDQIGRPLCPCRFYPDKKEEIKNRTWICACDDMQIYKYCHCLLFVDKEGLPITEYLPEGHEGREMYGLVKESDARQGAPAAPQGGGTRNRAQGAPIVAISTRLIGVNPRYLKITKHTYGG